MKIFNSASQQQENLDQSLSGAQSRYGNTWRMGSACALTNNIRRMVKDRPMLALVAGLGMVWMILAAKTANDGADQGYGDRDADAQDFGYLYSSGASSETQYDTASRYDTASMSERQSIKERVSSAARQMVTRAQEQSDRWRETLRRMAYEQPLLLGAIGLAVGAAIGALLPSSESEHRLIGAARDQTIDRIKARSNQAYDQMRETATREMQGIKQAVSEIVTGKKD